jgi:hypothetical protein
MILQVLWTRYFVEAQGYSVEDSVVHQDNQSSILFEKHGQTSSGKHTQHINIWYFFLTDRIATKEVSVECSTRGKMIADFFIKPLQGYTMNVDPAINSWQDERSVLRNTQVPKGSVRNMTEEVPLARIE